jgi:hypothetical protein
MLFVLIFSRLVPSTQNWTAADEPGTTIENQDWPLHQDTNPINWIELDRGPIDTLLTPRLIGCRETSDDQGLVECFRNRDRFTECSGVGGKPMARCMPGW